ncbi:unnamed protein product [Nesidiocoris tenuis]|uniref:Uncharacterized protein n=1 Tax=Nesidiocoris tenuis TaxID=355587 RepID=A0A6H5G216_9HEMI|nr:unnamed protein product [Nesidiocoris tenuis]
MEGSGGKVNRTITSKSRSFEIRKEQKKNVSQNNDILSNEIYKKCALNRQVNMRIGITALTAKTIVEAEANITRSNRTIVVTILKTSDRRIQHTEKKPQFNRVENKTVKTAIFRKRERGTDRRQQRTSNEPNGLTPGEGYAPTPRTSSHVRSCSRFYRFCACPRPARYLLYLPYTCLESVFSPQVPFTIFKGPRMTHPSALTSGSSA